VFDLDDDEHIPIRRLRDRRSRDPAKARWTPWPPTTDAFRRIAGGSDGVARLVRSSDHRDDDAGGPRIKHLLDDDGLIRGHAHERRSALELCGHDVRLHGV
jgi:hypothetical protein